jgi:hypothetical protein
MKQMTTVNAIETAKEAYKAALLKQVEPITQRIQEVKAELASLENQKRTIEAQVKLIDRKPSEGRVWSAEAKAKLSASLKAAAARKKAAQAAGGAASATPAAQGTEAPAPVVDNKMRAANDDSAPATSTKKNRSSAR